MSIDGHCKERKNINERKNLQLLQEEKQPFPEENIKENKVVILKRNDDVLRNIF